MICPDLADVYFSRSYETVRGTPLEELPVCYALFSRTDGVLCGVGDVLALIARRCAGPVVVRGKREGEPYRAGEVVLTIAGLFGELVVLETEYLGYLSLSGAAANMAAIVEAAGDVPVIDMAARHYPPELVPGIAVAAAVGGAAGTSTVAGHAEVHARFGVGNNQIQIAQPSPRAFGLYGSIPHALNAAYEGGSIASAVAYHERHLDLPLTLLVDFEGTEMDVIAEAATRFGGRLHAVRLDTAGNRVHQGGHDRPDRALEMRILSQASDRAAAQVALDAYGFGPGVTIESTFRVRDLLDRVGARETRIVVSSGFTLEKVKAFRACNAPMSSIGTGSWVRFAMFTSDIISVYQEEAWRPRCKAGRAEELAGPVDLPVLLEQGE